ncbi:MAG: hypothetical protein AAB512_04310 [Patescibacteria group bacterium]
MTKKLDTTWHLFLYAAFLVGAAAVYLSRYDSYRQFVVLALLVIFYIVWAIAYHHVKGDVTKKLFLEYLLIALIALGAGYLVLMS